MTLGMSLRPRGATAPALLEQLASTRLPMDAVGPERPIYSPRRRSTGGESTPLGGAQSAQSLWALPTR
jgi:hypothetical protein